MGSSELLIWRSIITHSLISFILAYRFIQWIILLNTKPFSFLFFSYFTPVSERQKHHINVVEEEIHHHPEKYPGIKPLEHPSPTEAEKEVKEFDKRYSLPKEPEPHIKPTL